MQPDRRIIFYLPLTIALVTVSVLYLAIVLEWMGASTGRGAMFCEFSDGLIKQPVNTYSNIGFVLAGLFIGWSQAHARFSNNYNALTNRRFVSAFYATLAVLIGPGSMAMHATMTDVGGFLDMLSMYLIASFIFSYALTRFFNIKNIGFVITFSLSLIILLYVNSLEDVVVPFVGFIGSLFFGIFLVAAAIIELLHHFIKKSNVDIKFGIATILVMGAAVFVWKISHTDGIWCSPDSLLQGHGLWHLLCALAVYLLYRFYVSEHIES